MSSNSGSKLLLHSQQLHVVCYVLHTTYYVASGALHSAYYVASGALHTEYYVASGALHTAYYVASGALHSAYYVAGGALHTEYYMLPVAHCILHTMLNRNLLSAKKNQKNIDLTLLL